MVAGSRLCLLLCVIALLWAENGTVRFGAKSLGAVALMLSLAVVGAIQTGFIDKLQQLPTSRIPVWNAAVHQIAESPLFGSGPNTFAPYYAQHIRQTNYPDFIIVDSRFMPWAHNLFLDVAIAFGIPVSILLLMLLLVLLMKAFKAKDPLGYAVFGSILLFLLASMAEFSYLRPYTLVLIAVYTAYLLPRPTS